MGPHAWTGQVRDRSISCLQARQRDLPGTGGQGPGLCHGREPIMGRLHILFKLRLRKCGPVEGFNLRQSLLSHNGGGDLYESAHKHRRDMG